MALTKIGINFSVISPSALSSLSSSNFFTTALANNSVDSAPSTSCAIKPISSNSLKLFSVVVIKLNLTGFNLFIISNPLSKGCIFSLNLISEVAIVAFVAKASLELI